MEFTKIRVRNLPTEEEYIQKKNKEYQALAKVPKFSLISNSIVALIVLVFAGIAITKSLHFDVEAFVVTMFGFGGLFFLCCKWNFDILKEYQAQKENHELFQTYLSFDTEDEMKFVQSDTEVCGKFTGLYFIRMLKENQHPRVWCELLSETAAELWFTYKRTKRLIRKVSGIHVALYAKFGHAGRNTRERHTLEFTLEICQLVFRLRIMKILAFCATIP